MAISTQKHRYPVGTDDMIEVLSLEEINQIRDENCFVEYEFENETHSLAFLPQMENLCGKTVKVAGYEDSDGTFRVEDQICPGQWWYLCDKMIRKI